MVPGRTTLFFHVSMDYSAPYEIAEVRGLRSLREQPLCFTWSLSFGGIHGNDHHLGGLQIASQSLRLGACSNMQTCG